MRQGCSFAKASRVEGQREREREGKDEGRLQRTAPPRLPRTASDPVRPPVHQNPLPHRREEDTGTPLPLPAAN
ncbi:hypothetical protein MATL_G00072760 [Megalops atlanticus]|uniref:Uncharacterized protein n=1 Tax=Megalops atlanticus TaxID=7932 RepID=A0A9D3Q5U0_MEGAT|nr:hypothetical protein MATL_G00072760 [Megalops atlanticus]